MQRSCEWSYGVPQCYKARGIHSKVNKSSEWKFCPFCGGEITDGYRSFKIGSITTKRW